MKESHPHRIIGNGTIELEWRQQEAIKLLPGTPFNLVPVRKEEWYYRAIGSGEKISDYFGQKNPVYRADLDTGPLYYVKGSFGYYLVGSYSIYSWLDGGGVYALGRDRGTSWHMFDEKHHSYLSRICFSSYQTHKGLKDCGQEHTEETQHATVADSQLNVAELEVDILKACVENRFVIW